MSAFASLRSRLLVLLLLLLIPVTLLLLYTYNQQRRDALRAVDADATRLLHLALDVHRTQVDAARQLLAAIAQIPGVGSGNSATCNKLMRNLLAHEPLYINFGVADAHGNVRCSALPTGGPLNLGHDTWFLQAVTHRHFAAGGYHVCRITHRRAITFSLPFGGKSEKPRGVVFATADVSWLQQLVKASVQTPGAQAFAVGDDGVLLAAYPKPAHALDALLPAVLERLGDAGHRTVSAVIDGKERVYAGAALPASNGGVRLIVGLPKSPAIAQADRTLLHNLLWLAAVAIFAGVAGWFGAEVLIVRRVHALVDTARTLSGGDYSARADLKNGVAELSLLGQAIDHLAAMLERREAQRHRAAEFGAIIDRSPNEIYVIADADLRFMHVNAGACRRLGYSSDALHSMSPLDILPDHDGASLDRLLAPLRSGAVLQLQFETRHRRKDGSVYPVETRMQLTEFAGRRALTAIAHDITGRKAAERRLADSEDRLRLALDAAGQGLWDWDLTTDEVYYDATWTRLMGYHGTLPEPTMGAWERHMQEDDRDTFRQLLNEYRLGHRPSFEAEFRIERDGEWTWIAAVGRITQRDESGAPLRMMGTIQDTTERRRSEEQLSYLAQYDTLTGLPNRYLFRDRLTRAMASARRKEKMLALMFLDLDNFKEINDTLGHDSGDVLLQSVGKRLQECLRDTDTIARPGGDEFTIVLEEINHVDDATKIAQKVLAAFAQPFRFNDKEMYTTVSIGVTLFPLDVDDIDSLLKNADIAMYQAKHQGGNRCQFFSADMSHRTHGRTSLLNRLRAALDENAFVLHYQPIVDAKSRCIVAVEALLRWQDVELGWLPPSSFLPTAEETGLIVPIGEWVIQQACTDMRAWHDAGFPQLRVSVNVSPRQFRQRSLTDHVERVLFATGLDPALLEIEITESALMLGVENALSALQLLGEMGVGLSIDDFGTGYSSLRYLKQVAVRRLKVDRTFVADIERSGTSTEIIRGVVALAHSLQLSVTAEGVETDAQLTLLRSLDCDEYQGFYFGAPVRGDQMTRLLFAGADAPANPIAED